MTDNQLQEQLERLTIFGPFDEKRFKQYREVLGDRSYDRMRAVVSFMLREYDKKHFPLPAAILAGFSRAHSQPEYAPVDDGSYRDAEITAAWASCYRLCWMIKDTTRRVYEFGHLVEGEVWENNPANKAAVIERYRNKFNKLADYLASVGVDVVPVFSLTGGSDLIPTTSDDDLPF